MPVGPEQLWGMGGAGVRIPQKHAVSPQGLHTAMAWKGMRGFLCLTLLFMVVQNSPSKFYKMSTLPVRSLS